MKSKINKFYIVLMAFAFMMVSSCDLPEANIDPDNPTDASLKLTMPTMLGQAAYNHSAMGARMPGIIMQHLKGFDAQQVAYTDYVIGEDVMNNFWRTGMYAGVLKDTRVMIDKAQEADPPQVHYEGIAKIIMAESYGVLASFFGDVPFTDALKGTDVLKPSYDSQESVYAAVQSLLDEAIGLLNQASPLGGPSSADDLVFAGDAPSWIATAYALKARYYMHLTKVNGTSAATSALSALTNAFTSLAGQPDFAWDNSISSGNPLAKFGTQRTNTMIIGDFFAAIMTGDPRQSLYMTLDGSDWKYFDNATTSLVWSQLNSVIPYISYPEIKFMEAEALLLTGGTDAQVDAALTAAITANMDQVGVSSANYAAYVATNGIVTGLTTTALKQERIITEAYKALYGQAEITVWTNYRRTGFPVLIASSNGVNGFNPSGVIPRRFLYVSSEEQTNEEMVAAAKANQGCDLLDCDTWAFK